MCGICGWIDPDHQHADAIVAGMADRLHHRGPDDGGVASGRGWGLGFRRLSILDLSPSGHQPMSGPDGASWLAFNGEIYNYVELRRDLEQQGERFVGTSDTEVLLRLLMRHGEAALALLNGMFALAFVDARRRTFLLARDRLGVKPLHYRITGRHLRFASELKALLAWRGERPEVSPDAVAQYLTLGYLANETCIFEGFAKLPPAHAMTGSLDDPAGARIAPYWHLALNEDPARRSLTAGECDELESLLRDATRIRLRSDVPVGVFLSGGIDSGLVAALAASASDTPPLALTVGFAEASSDETALARRTARHLGLEHRVLPQPVGGLAALDRLAWHFDEPFGDPSALPTFTLCEAAASHATVLLSGDGGDEAFGGYRRVVESLRRERLITMCSRVGPALHGVSRFAPSLSMERYRLLKLALPDLGAAAAFDGIPGDPALAHVVHPRLRDALPGSAHPLWTRWHTSRGAPLTVRQQDLDYRLYLPDDILVKMDRASMAHSIEVRSPLLDVRLVEWAARLPRSTLLNHHEGKLPLRALARHTLPAEVCAGAKKGFGVPHDAWFRSPAGLSFARERLLDRGALDLGFWARGGVEDIIARHRAARGRGFGLLLWRLLMLEAWSRHFVSGAGLQDARDAHRTVRPTPALAHG